MSLQTAGLSGCFFSRCSFSASPPPFPLSFLHSSFGSLSTFGTLRETTIKERERACALSFLLGLDLLCVRGRGCHPRGISARGW